MRARPIALLAAALTVVAAAALAAPPPAAWRLSPDGFGPVRIGMTQAQVVRALGSRLNADAPPAGAGELERDDWRACHEAEAVDAPGLYFMFEAGRLTSISIGEASRIRTTAGLGLGDTEARVRRAYGAALKVQPHEYEEAPAHYLTVKGGRRGHGIKFTTDKTGVVTGVSAGGASIGYSEGCA